MPTRQSTRKVAAKDAPPVGKIMANDLARIITDAAIFARRGRDLPVLNNIRFESSSDRLTVAATDRFTMGAATASYLEDHPGADVVFELELARANMLVSLAKSCRQAFSHADVLVTNGQVSFAFSSGESLTLPTVNEGQFPDWRKVIRSLAAVESTEPVSVFGLNPQYLAKFGRVSNADRITLKIGDPSRGILAAIGDQFVGVIMPVRLEDPKWVQPQWISTAAKPVEVKPKIASRAKKAS